MAIVAAGLGVKHWLALRAARPIRNNWTRESPAIQPTAPAGDCLRVLFIGNSFTYYCGGQSALVAELARAAHEPQAPHFGEMTVAHGTLDDMRQSPPIAQRIAERTPAGDGAWDIVVIQPHLFEPMGSNRPRMRDNVKAIDAMIRNAGARTMLYMTWTQEDKLAAEPAIAQAFRDAGAECDSDPANVAASRKMLIAPVGVAWAAAIRERPDLGLYAADHGHPSPAGSYLAACVFYATLYHKSPEGLPAKLATITLEPAEAGFLQRVAWQTVSAESPRPATAP